MPAIRDDQLEALRDALVDAYPELADLEQLAQFGLGIVLEAEVDTQGGTRTVAWNLLRWARKEGRLDRLFDAARQRRPGNERLRAFAASIGHATVRSTQRALQPSSFDLEELEGRCADVLEGQLARGLRVLLFAGADPQVFDCVVERVRPLVHRGAERPPPDSDVPLRPLVASVERSIELVARLAHDAARRHVLVKVHAAEATAPVVAGFVGGVRARVAQALPHDLVLLVRTAADLQPPLAAGLADEQLPPPVFALRHLYRWVERVSDGQGWSEALKTDFKEALRALASPEGASMLPEDVYYAVTQAILCLRDNPDEAALREWIAVQRDL